MARFSICIGALSFATHLAAPFFAVYMLQELHYGYLLYTSVQLAASITGFLTSPGWGRVGDRLGNYAVLRCTVARRERHAVPLDAVRASGVDRRSSASRARSSGAVSTSRRRTSSTTP